MTGRDFGSGLPPGLKRAAPRPVCLTGAGKAVLLLALFSALAAPVVGVLLHEVARRSREKAIAARRAAATVDGVVVGLSRSGKRGRAVHYEFHVGGAIYAGRFLWTRSRQPPYRAGSVLKIAYLPSDPRQNWPLGYEPQAIPAALAPAVATTLVAVAAVAGVCLRRQRRLLEDGRVVVGKVTAIERPSRRGRFRVRYEFRLPIGAQRSGDFYFAQPQPPPMGSPLVIIYDPDDPRRQRRYPFPLVCVCPP